MRAKSCTGMRLSMARLVAVVSMTARRVKDGGGKMERTRADQMGMLGTVMNALAVSDAVVSMTARRRERTSL